MWSGFLYIWFTRANNTSVESGITRGMVSWRDDTVGLLQEEKGIIRGMISYRGYWGGPLPVNTNVEWPLERKTLPVD